jgi:cell filamentation protein
VADDPYTDPGTGVLRNLLGISDQDELDRVEAEVTAVRLAQLAENPLPGAYDLAHLQALHRRIFGDVYAWAGELRTVAIAKQDLFCLPQHIRAFADEVFGRLARNGYLQGLDHDAFVSGLADLFGDINALHPFREGNGRTQRAFLTQLARSAGHQLSWQGLDQQANIEASQAAHRGDNEPLRALLDRLVDRARSRPSSSHPARTASGTYRSPTEAQNQDATPRIPAQPSPRSHSPKRKPPDESPRR